MGTGLAVLYGVALLSGMFARAVEARTNRVGGDVQTVVHTNVVHVRPAPGSSAGGR